MKTVNLLLAPPLSHLLLLGLTQVSCYSSQLQAWVNLVVNQGKGGIKKKKKKKRGAHSPVVGVCYSATLEYPDCFLPLEIINLRLFFNTYPSLCL